MRNRPVMSRLSSIGREHGWSYQSGSPVVFDKDGYEVYFYPDEPGYELTIRHHDTRERVPVFSYDEHVQSPKQVAVVAYILSNVESMVEQCLTEL